MSFALDLYCAVPGCGLPAEYVGDAYTMSGAGFGPRGTECIVTYRRVMCVAGHRYAAEIDSIELPPE